MQLINAWRENNDYAFCLIYLWLIIFMDPHKRTRRVYFISLEYLLKKCKAFRGILIRKQLIITKTIYHLPLFYTPIFA